MEENGVCISAAGLIIGKIKTTPGNSIKIDNTDYESALEGFELRHVDRISRLVIGAASLALKNRGLHVEKGSSNDYGIFWGTKYGAIESIHSFDMVAVEKGAAFVNPGLFPSTVLNSPACQVSIQLSVAGPIHTVCNGHTSALDAVGLGYNYVKSGLASMIMAGGADEISELQTLMHENDHQIGEASGILLLEKSNAVPEARSIVEIAGYGSTSLLSDSLAEIRLKIVELITNILDAQRIPSHAIECMRFSTYLPSKEGREMADGVCRDLKYEIPIEYMETDWMGASGIVQIASALNFWEETFKEIAAQIIVGVDNDKVSVLVLVTNSGLTI
ncbi:beta-ketoacyl synthase N-terminal-like domain-containing protein [Pelosinus baikalensis]|uniref:Beta-ketoacyl synthase-like N-terminal domain-containing protein n=1 Tax=Pelosinus baikalensis TaxID=2892015 RepID=A0ABS8HTK3_9FIRM|nr:beta-ketoacyl synthase N-terminal-like domain-containing protein [Pelosinus baikalensis]MCC5466500.1 hypothetical protein [Pelosinus baikalensis]